MKKSLIPFTPFFICLFVFFYSWNVYWGGNRWTGFFLSDSGGYYGYLPATFIYHDFSFSFIEDISKNKFNGKEGYDFRSGYNGKSIDKWFCGTAVAIAPFFLAAHARCLAGGGTDGYGFAYAIAVSMAAIFYLLAGLLALQKIMRHFFSGEKLIAFILVITVFATNLFYYATSEPLMAHVYSFAFVNLFVLSVLRLLHSGEKNNIILCGLLLGMIVLIRPVNGLIVFIVPFLAGSREKFIQLISVLFSKWKVLILSIVFMTGIIFLQTIFYRLESGYWMIYSYGAEKMNLLQPHLIDFLFSYKKGLFVYIPFTLISTAGFILLFRKNRWQFYTLMIFLFLLLYTLSSWWNWWYGGSFGSRPIIEYLFIFSILAGQCIQNFRPAMRRLFISLCLVCLIVCQVQTYQYRYYFIHWDQMNKDRYWKVFMRVDLILKKENPNADLQ